VRTFIFKDAKSSKFWNIEVHGKNFTVTFGRIGTKGQTQTKEFTSPGAAQQAQFKLIRQKLDKGYVETTTAAAPKSAPPAPKPARPAPVHPAHAALEKAVRDNPDDLAAHAALADLLSEHGDPRGELIQVQLALEDDKRPAAERKALQKREKKLLQTHGREWLGSLAPYLLDQEGIPEYLQGTQQYQFQFARGRLDYLRVPDLKVAFARVLAAAPEARSLRRLFIEGTAYEEPGEYERGKDIPTHANVHCPALYPLLGAPFLGNLRVFHLGEPMEGNEYANCHTDGEAAAELVKKMPQLAELYLLAHRVDTDQLFALKTLTRLRILQVYHCTNYPLDTLAANRALGNLTHLLLFPHSLEIDDEPYITVPGVRALVNSRNLPALTHLQLRLSPLGDEGCAEIVRSKVLRRLKVLDLMHGRITDEGARTLADCPDLKNLELLELSYNRLTAAGVKALKATGIKVQSAHQYGPESDEEEYLWAGDME
jgi:uncharacterized protein (TIGR02996 family)